MEPKYRMEKMESMVGVNEALSRIAVVIEQYNELDTSLAQMEMQADVMAKAFKNTPGATNNQELIAAMNQAEKAKRYYNVSKNALLELVKEQFDLDIDSLKEELLVLRILQERYVSLHGETKKLEVAFDILAEANAFDEDSSAEDSRESFETTLDITRRERDIAREKLSNRLRNLQAKNLILPVTGDLKGVLSVGSRG